MKKRSILRLLPFLIVFVILIFTWCSLITSNFEAQYKHYLGLSFFLITTILYFIKFKYGLYGTLLFLLLATFNFIAIFPKIITSSAFIRVSDVKISSPSLNMYALLILIFYLVVNTNYLIDSFKSKI